MLFDISATKTQSFHHEISFLQFFKFSEKLQNYVTGANLQTIISSFNKSLDQTQCKSYFHSRILAVDLSNKNNKNFA